MGYAFISYSSKNQQMADSFKAFFNQNGIETWMAPGDIPFGSTYTSAINRAIKESGCFVLLLSGNAQESPWVLKETERAISTGKTIFTVLLDDVSMNDDFEFMLSTSQAVAIRKIDESDDKVRRLIKAIKMYTGEERQETVINSSLRHELDNKSISPAEPSSKPKNNICQSDLTPLGLQYTTGGDPGGLCEQALKYYNGTGGYKKDERKAVKLFRESANYYNYVPAYNYLGRIFMERRNFANASKWYRSSAVAYTAEGLCMMGYFYQTGLGGVKRSTSSALECYENAAATGEFEQIIDITKKFLEGRVVPREDGVAADILAAAVKAGSEDARFYMAKSDQSGFGVNADSLPVQPQPYNEELKIGDKVEFGLYPFDDKRTWKKIGWEILDIKNDKALLWADFCVDAYPYHYIRKSCDWSSCSLRDWLRNEFTEDAFQNEERMALCEGDVVSSKNSNSKQSSGQATCDRVFILGNEEFEQYGITESRLRTFASPYAKRRGVFCSAESDAFYWTRTPGSSEEATQMFIGGGGHKEEHGSYIDLKNRGIRPAIWVDYKMLNNIVKNHKGKD